MDLNWITVVLLVIIGAGGGFVQRVSGFGLGIFVMLFLPYLMPIQAAAAVSCLFGCGTSTFNAAVYRKFVPYKTVLPMLCAALVSIPVAVYFSGLVDERLFKILLGSVLVVLSIYFLFFNKRMTIKPGILNGILAGTTGGVLSGLFSTGGPPAVLYLTSATKDNVTYFAAIQFYFAVTGIYATATRVIGGSIDLKVLVYSLIGLIGCMIGDTVGKLIFNKLDGEKLRLIIYIGMIVSGVLMIVK